MLPKLDRLEQCYAVAAICCGRVLDAMARICECRARRLSCLLPDWQNEAEEAGSLFCQPACWPHLALQVCIVALFCSSLAWAFRFLGCVLINWNQHIFVARHWFRHKCFTVWSLEVHLSIDFMKLVKNTRVTPTIFELRIVLASAFVQFHARSCCNLIDRTTVSSCWNGVCHFSFVSDFCFVHLRSCCNLIDGTTVSSCWNGFCHYSSWGIQISWMCNWNQHIFVC